MIRLEDVRNHFFFGVSFIYVNFIFLDILEEEFVEIMFVEISLYRDELKIRGKKIIS